MPNRPLSLQHDLRYEVSRGTITDKDIRILCQFLINFPIKTEIKQELKELVKLSQYELPQLVNLASLLSIDFEMLYSKAFCLDALVNQLILNDMNYIGIIPVKYRSHQNSSTTSLKSILNQFENQELTNSILRKLQIPFAYFDQHRPLSIIVIRDALGLLYPHIQSNELHLAAFENCEKFMLSEFGKTIQGEVKLKDLYELSFESSSLIEKSWTYEILSSNHQFIQISSKQSKFESSQNSYTNYLTSLCRIKFIESIGRFCGYQNIFTSQFKQIASDEIIFTIDFEKAKRFF